MSQFQHSMQQEPRLSLVLSHEQFDALNELIPRGMKNRLFSYLIDCVIDELRKDQQQFILALIAKDISLIGLLNKRESEGQDNGPNGHEEEY